MTRENAIKIVNDYFNKQFVPIDLSEAIDILTAAPPVSQRFVEPSEELDKVAEEYAQDETMSGLAERAFKAGAEWMAGQGVKIGETEIYLEDDGGEPPYDGTTWLELTGTEYPIPEDKFKDRDKVDIILLKKQ